MTGVQSAKINFDMENPTTLELEAVSDKSFYYLSQCDGSELIRVDYKDFTWYFAPRTFELKVNKLTTPIAKFSAVDAMGAFRSQIAYNGVDATHVRQNFKTTFQQKVLPRIRIWGITVSSGSPRSERRIRLRRSRPGRCSGVN